MSTHIGVKKLTDAPWLAEVPAHWDIKPLFTVLTEAYEPNSGMKETNLLSLSHGRIVKKDINTVDGLLPESFDTYQVVEPGDIVLRLTDLQNDQRSLRVGFVRERGIVTSAYVNLRVKNQLDPKFAAYYLHNADRRKVFYTFGGGVRQSMKYADLKRLPFVIPPLADQIAISASLDDQLRTIEDLMNAKERLLELLAERRQAIIETCVTSGTSGSVKLRDSGLPWLGNIPEHWSIIRAKFLWHEVSLPVRDCDEIVTCFRDGQVTLRRNRREDGFTNAVKELGYQGVRAGQLVIHSMDAFAGAIGVSDSEGKCSPEYIICDPIYQEVYNPYFGLLLRVVARRGFIQAICSAVRERAPRLHFSQLKRMYLPVPPLSEQRQIVERVSAELLKIDRLSSALRTSLVHLREQQSAVISAAVTGKIQVREYRPQEAAATCL